MSHEKLGQMEAAKNGIPEVVATSSGPEASTAEPANEATGVKIDTNQVENLKHEIEESIGATEKSKVGPIVNIMMNSGEGSASTPLQNKEDGINGMLEHRFGFNSEEIAALEEHSRYSKMSLGQKQFILKSLTNATLEKVDEVAEGRFQAEQQKRGVGSRLLSGLLKGTRVADVKKRTFDEMRSGGLGAHMDTIEAIMTRVEMMNTPIIENERGEIEVQYGAGISSFLRKGNPENASLDNNEDVEAMRMERRFNQAATALQNIPPEWQSASATKEQRRAAEDAQDQFKYIQATCEQMIGNIHANDPKIAEQFSQKVSEAKSNIELNRLMDAHPDNERVLHNLYKEESKAGLVLNDLTKRDNKGYYMVGGASARLLTRMSEIAGVASATAIGGVVGAFRGATTAKRNIRENEAAMRRGAGNKLDSHKKSGVFDIAMKADVTSIERGGEAGAKSYLKKMDDIANKITNAKDPEEAAFYQKMLENRVKYAVERAKQGKVSFGNKDERMKNQLAFMDSVKNASAIAAAYDPAVAEEVKATLERRMEKVYGKQDKQATNERRKYIAKFATKNAVLGALMSAGGYELTHKLMEAWHVGGGDEATTDTYHYGAHPEKPEGIHVEARDDTYVHMDEPFVKIVDDQDMPPENIPNPIPVHADDSIIKTEKVEFSSKGAIETFRQLKEKLLVDYKNIAPEKMPSTVKEIIDSDPTKMAIKFGFYKPGDIDESAMVLKGSTLEIDSAGNLDYHHVGGENYHILENADGNKSYSYDEKMFDYNGKTEMPSAESSDSFDQEYSDEYIIKHGERIPVINHDDITPPTDNENYVDKGEHYEEGIIAKEMNPIPAENIRPQVGKTLSGGMRGRFPNIPQAGEPGYRGAGMHGKFPPMPSISHVEQNIPENIQNVAHEYQPGQHYELPRSPQGTYYKTIKVNGREIMIDTHSTNPNNAFDGRVNRLTTKLFSEKFSSGRNAFGDKIVDPAISNRLANDMAADDIYETPSGPINQETADYLNTIRKIHNASGYEPKPGQTTDIYVKEALQHMKNDAKNIRTFVNELVYSDTVAHGAKETAVGDDVYR